MVNIPKLCWFFFSEIWLGWFVEIDDKLEKMSDYREIYNYKEISFITNSFLKVMQIWQIPSSVALGTLRSNDATASRTALKK